MLAVSGTVSVKCSSKHPLTTLPPLAHLHINDSKSAHQSATMISRCLPFLVGAMVVAAGIASESLEAGSKTHANLRYVQRPSHPATRHAYYLTHATTALSPARCVCTHSLPVLLSGLVLLPPSYAPGAPSVQPTNALTNPPDLTHTPAVHCSHHLEMCTP